MFPETDVEEAFQMLERVRDTVRSNAVHIRGDNQTVGTTFSGGVASTEGDGATLEMLMRQADARLLAAKAAGRDRIVTSGEGLVEVTGS